MISLKTGVHPLFFLSTGSLVLTLSAFVKVMIDPVGRRHSKGGKNIPCVSL